MRKVYIVPVVIFFVAIGYILLRPSSSQKILVEIPKGSTAERSAEILYKNKIIPNRAIFLWWLRITGNSRKIKAGLYEFRVGSSVFEVADKLLKGLSYRVKVTIPEGFTAKQIAELLAQKGLVNEETFLEKVKKDKLEGYLFPETYFFEVGVSEEKIIEKMKQEFDRRITPEILEKAKKLKLSLHQLITLASMIEKEAGKDDRKLVSAVFHNRLKKGMYLESCATILYALGKHKDKLNYKDLKVKSPYNTYLNYGLPPGPISNPGMDSILAAVEPAQTDVLFFVVDKASGTHIFSRYYRDHIKVQDKKSK